MYNLDINFLNDRVEQAAPKATPKGGGAANTPLIIGALVAVALPAATFGANLYLQGVGRNLTAKRDSLTQELTTVTGQAQEANTIAEKTAQAEAEIQNLIGVFQELQPISVSLQEVSNQTPQGVLMLSFESKDGTPPEAAEGAVPPPPDPNAPPPDPNAPPPAPPTLPKVVTLKGQALSYAQLNDFLLGLKNSNFFVRDTIKLSTVELVQASDAFQFEPFQPPVDENADPEEAAKEAIDPEELPKVKVNLPYVVKFTIDGELSGPPPAEVLDKLRALKADGLVSRIEALQRMGVIAQ